MSRRELRRIDDRKTAKNFEVYTKLTDKESRLLGNPSSSPNRQIPGHVRRKGRVIGRVMMKR